jgi:hypothetical protein
LTCVGGWVDFREKAGYQELEKHVKMESKKANGSIVMPEGWKKGLLSVCVS